MSAYSLEIKRSAEKELSSLPTFVLRRMIDKIEKLALDPRPSGCKKLKGGDDAYRIRVGEYRAIYVIDDARRRVSVTRIRHRGDVYE